MSVPTQESFRRDGRLWSVVVALVIFLSCTIHAQTSRVSGIAGRVADSDGEPIPNANLFLVHLPTGDTLHTSTRADGTYSLLNIQVGGPYRLLVSHIGFSPQVRAGFQLHTAEVMRLDFQLREQAIEGDEVIVAGTHGEILSPTTSGASLHMESAQMEQLPLPVTSFEDAARLSAYVVGGSVLGRNARYNDVQIDGVRYTDQFGMLRAQPVIGGIGVAPISFEVIQEFRANLSPFDVSRSGFTGGAFDAVTRSGTSTYQGSVHMDGTVGWTVGRSPDDNRRDMPDFVDARAGFQTGGPLEGTPIFYYVAGEFNRLSYPIDRKFGARKAGATVFPIPPIAVTILEHELDTLFHYDVGSFEHVILERNATSLFARLDARLAKQHRASVRYNFFRTQADRSPDIPGVFAAHSVSRNVTATHRITGELSSMFSNDVTNQTLLSYAARDFRSAILGQPFPFLDFAVSSASQQWMHLLMGSDGGAEAGRSREHVIDLQNTTSIATGAHTLSFGIQSELHWFDMFQLDDQFGRYLYNSLGPLQRVRPKEYQLRYVRPGIKDPGVRWRALETAAYVQDEWEISPRFRLSLGLRLDIPFFLDHPEENRAVCDVFAPLGYNLRTSRLPQVRPLLSPRLAFNVNPKGDRTSQIRGGIGVLTGRIPFIWLSNQFAQTGLKYVHIKENRQPPIPVADPYNQPRSWAGVSPRETAEINVTDPDFVFPQVLRGTAAMDLALPWNLVGSLEVVFSRSINEVVYRNINLKKYGELNPTLSGDRRPTYGYYVEGLPWMPGTGRWEYSRYSDAFTNVILLSNTDGGSSLHSTVQLQRKPDKDGLFLSLSYTYGSARDINSGISDQAYAQWKYNPAYDPNNPEVHYSAFDREHSVVAAASYRYEWGAGWAATLGAIYTGVSGQPFSYVYDGDMNGDGENYNDLFYVPASAREFLLYSTEGGLLSPNNPEYTQFMSFVQNDPYLSSHRGRVVERNGARTPWSHVVDVRSSIRIPLFFGHTLELHCDIYNLLNLLDRTQGIVWNTPANIMPIARVFTIDGIGRPGLQWVSQGSTPLIPESLESRWRMRLGMKYTF